MEDDPQEFLTQLVADYFYTQYEYEVINNNDELICSFTRYLERRRKEV